MRQKPNRPGLWQDRDGDIWIVTPENDKAMMVNDLCSWTLEEPVKRFTKDVEGYAPFSRIPVEEADAVMDLFYTGKEEQCSMCGEYDTDVVDGLCEWCRANPIDEDDLEEES
ncbi:hypothetical protein [Bifidobacterium catulorum]|uniref:Uncharacterized protein n=1 Tax=Bifidobacterium catulorum TaxID=1630173 RepID=A0A2U2MUF9_9BIFI|nr:hypothetical protein [Bifidobacterium catulorum]PWG60489.1 hypothetical protein DF200_02515 [Bifidobacterium catulorum]